MFRRRKERKELAEVLEALNEPSKAEVILRAMPAKLGRTLRALSDLAFSVSRVYRLESADVPAPPNRLRAGRARLMAAVDELHVKRQQRYRAQTRWAMRFAGAVLALVILLVPTGVYAFRASDQSLPGQALYPLKHTQESYMLRRTQEEPNASVALTLTFTDERIREIQALIKKGRPIPASVVISIDVLTRRAVEAAAWTPKPLMETYLQIIGWYNQTHIQTLEALKIETTPENQGLLSEAQTVLVERYLVTEAALKNPALFRAAYQAGEPERLATPGGGPLGTPEPTRVIDDILKEGPIATPTDLPITTTPTGVGPTATPSPASQDAPDGSGQPGDDPSDSADPNKPETPPGQDVRPETPPGQEESPSDPPGQDNRPNNPPDQDKDKNKP